MRLAAGTLALLLVAGDVSAQVDPASGGDSAGWRTHRDVSTGSTVRFPAILRPDPAGTEPGRATFVAPDGTRLVLTGERNLAGYDRDGLETALMVARAPDEAMLFVERRRDGILLAGRRGDVSFVEHHELSRDRAVIARLTVSWPVAEGPRWDALASRIVSSLRAGSPAPRADRGRP